MKRKILVVAAHPDDEVLGCGGTIARLVKEGHEVFTLILGEGITARDDSRDRKKQERDLAELKKQSKDANKILGVRKIFFFDFPDNRFDTVPLLSIVKVIEKVKNIVQPDIIFTHCREDLNIDHQITYKAVITATRPLQNEVVKEIYSFEVLSSTEWNYPLRFSPDVFYDIKHTLEIKLKAMKEYLHEVKEFPQPRSVEAIKLNAKMWGGKIGLEHAEAFKMVRIIK